MRPTRPLYIDSPLSRFLGVCAIVIVVALGYYGFSVCCGDDPPASRFSFPCH